MSEIHKYIRTGEGFILWPAHWACTHREVARATAIYRGQMPPISAGFVSFDAPGVPTCGGMSESMGLSSKPEDSMLLAVQLGAKHG